jgi:hypothetical protein
MERKYPKLKELRSLKTHVSKKENPKKFKNVMKKFEEPFNIILGKNEYELDIDYSLKNILKPILSDKKQASPGDFPNNIEEIYYFIIDEEYDDYGDYWEMFCKLSNGNYAYFRASVCSCGFGMTGNEMKLYVSGSYKKLLDEAFGKYDYEEFMELFKKK